MLAFRKIRGRAAFKQIGQVATIALASPKTPVYAYSLQGVVCFEDLNYQRR